MKFKNYLILITLFLIVNFLVYQNVYAINSGDIWINEIAWMGNDLDSNNEWIELKNNTEQDINLDNFKISSQNGLEINLEGNLLPQDYFLLERTDDESVSDVMSDLIYTGNLNNDGDILSLYDAELNLIDQVDASSGWLAGNKDENLTMERCILGWHNSSQINGTPKAENSSQVISECGNNTIEDNEECDDGNLILGDGCSDTCLIEINLSQLADGILINEFIANPNTGETEWIELFNTNSENVDLNNWIIEDNTGATYGGGNGAAELEDLYILAGDYLVLNKGEHFSFGINNGGDILILKNSSGDIVDQIIFGDGANVNSLDLENSAEVADKGYTLARNAMSLDTDIDNADFKVTTNPTPGLVNQIIEPADESSSGRKIVIQPEVVNPETESEVENINYNPSDVVINELVSDPNDDLSENEWIELFNNTDSIINLAGWTLEDGSETIENLSGIILVKGFYVLENPKFKLNNNGDNLWLKSKNGDIVDQIAYGNWDDGDISDNALTAKSPNSLARKVDGQDSNYDANDFVVVSPTKGASNIFEQSSTSDFKIRINEILPNPEGSDSEAEFIEIYNFGDSKINLDGFKLGDGSSKRYKIENLELNALSYIAFYRSLTGIALNNSGQEEVAIYDASGNQIDKVEYSGSIKEELAYAYFDGEFSWTSKSTPEEMNILEIENQVPKAVVSFDEEIIINQEIIFDGSDSNDSDGDKLNFKWTLGNEILGEENILKYTFDKIGEYQLVLTVEDENNLVDSLELNLKVVDDAGEVLGEKIYNQSEVEIYLSEIMPNPEGADTDGEWIEVCAVKDSNLKGFSLDDIEGGSSAYLIEENLNLKANECHIFDRKQTGIALNNSNELVRLIDSTGKIIDEVFYEKSQEGASYAVDSSGHWFWLIEPSPGKANPQNSEWQTIEIVSNGDSKSENLTGVQGVKLKDIRSLPLESLIQTSGIVSVEPGLLGSQIFYLAGSGIQVYMYSKDFPELELGDYIEVIGVLAESGDEKRIKLKQKDDIIILEKNKEIPQGHQVTLDQIGEDFEGSLICFEGEMIEKSGSNLFIDDGTEEVKVYIKSSTGIKLPKLNEGEKMKICGILGQTSEGYRILPRYENDIEILTPVTDDLSGDLGKITEVAESQRQEKLIQYLIVTIIVLFTALITSLINSYLMRRKQNSIDR